MWKTVGISICFLTLPACGRDRSPQPPAEPGQQERVNGTESFAWDQRADDVASLGAIRYAAYVDGTRSELTSVTCESTPTSQGFACRSPLPAMSPGSHTLELASFIVAGGSILESARSLPLRLLVTASTSSSLAGLAVDRLEPASGGLQTTIGGLTVRLSRVLGGLNGPVDLAVAPDGRVFIAEISGRIHIVDPSAPGTAALSISEAPMRALALALDPDFAENGAVYLAAATAFGNLPGVASTSGDSVFELFRFRNGGHLLSERIRLLGDVPASSDPHAALRFAADKTLLLALDDGDDRRAAASLGSPNGKILRLHRDGTTPDDQPSLTPVYFSGLLSPRAMAWRPGTRELWIVEGGSSGASVLYVVRQELDSAVRVHARAAFKLPFRSDGSSLVFYGSRRIPELTGNLLVASVEGRHVLRIVFDPADPVRVVSTERLLQDLIGGPRTLAEGPHGELYIATDRELYRLEP